jgi:hypothetical protein
VNRIHIDKDRDSPATVLGAGLLGLLDRKLSRMDPLDAPVAGSAPGSAPAPVLVRAEQRGGAMIGDLLEGVII